MVLIRQPAPRKSPPPTTTTTKTIQTRARSTNNKPPSPPNGVNQLALPPPPSSPPATCHAALQRFGLCVARACPWPRAQASQRDACRASATPAQIFRPSRPICHPGKRVLALAILSRRQHTHPRLDGARKSIRIHPRGSQAQNPMMSGS
jgi:hypothetical protein